MIIAQISDTHIYPDEPNLGNRMPDFERCVADINRLDPQPDVVIHTGDIAHNGTPEKYREAFRVLDQLRSPFFVVAGNRDDRALLRSKLPSLRYLAPDSSFFQYSVETFPLRLISIDTKGAINNMGGYCDARADNLRLALAEHPNTPTVIFMHHPPFEIVESTYRWQFNPPVEIEKVEKALEGQSQVIRVFCGHAHRDARGVVAGIPVSCVPSVAIGLRFGEYPDNAPVYQVHRLGPDSEFNTETRIVR